MMKFLNLLRKKSRAAAPSKESSQTQLSFANVVRRLPNGHIAFGLDENAPTIDPSAVCFCGHCRRCRFADAMINGLLERFPKFKEWTREQPPIFWLNYRAHYQAIADGVLAILETYHLGEENEMQRTSSKRVLARSTR